MFLLPRSHASCQWFWDERDEINDTFNATVAVQKKAQATVVITSGGKLNVAGNMTRVSHAQINEHIYLHSCYAVRFSLQCLLVYFFFACLFAFCAGELSLFLTSLTVFALK